MTLLFDEAFLKKLEYLYIVSRRVFAGRVRAERATRKIGAGLEFADHRAYARGDDPRYLDWNVVGRMDRLLVRLFEEEEDLSIYLLLDTSRSMTASSRSSREPEASASPADRRRRPLSPSARPPLPSAGEGRGEGGSGLSPFDYARQLAAALAYIALANLDRVSIVPFSASAEVVLPPARGKGRIYQVFHALEAVQPDGVTSLAAAFDSFVAQTRRAGLAVVLSDLFDPAGFEAGLNRLRWGRFEVFVLHTHWPGGRPADADLDGELRLVDAETGRSRSATLTPATLRRYDAAFRRYQERLARFCLDHGIGFVRAPTDVPFDRAILDVFRQGGFLK
jgi:uncharacterized protein (DUF58 family)